MHHHFATVRRRITHFAPKFSGINWKILHAVIKYSLFRSW